MDCFKCNNATHKHQITLFFGKEKGSQANNISNNMNPTVSELPYNVHPTSYGFCETCTTAILQRIIILFIMVLALSTALIFLTSFPLLTTLASIGLLVVYILFLLNTAAPSMDFSSDLLLIIVYSLTFLGLIMTVFLILIFGYEDVFSLSAIFKPSKVIMEQEIHYFIIAISSLCIFYSVKQMWFIRNNLFKMLQIHVTTKGTTKKLGYDVSWYENPQR